MGVYNFATGAFLPTGAVTVTNNTLAGNRFEGVFIDQGTANVTNNNISGEQHRRRRRLVRRQHR